MKLESNYILIELQRLIYRNREKTIGWLALVVNKVGLGQAMKAKIYQRIQQNTKI